MRKFVLFAFLALGSCSTREFVAEGTEILLRNTALAFDMQKSVAHAREAAPALLVQLDGFIQAFPENEKLLLRGAEFNCAFALAFVEGEDDERAALLYEKGANYALRVLAAREGFSAAYRGPLPGFKDFLQGLSAASAPALFWAANSMALDINLGMDLEKMSEMAKIEAMMQRSLELDESYYFAGAHLYFGSYSGGRTEVLGGDPGKAKLHFERAFELTHHRFMLAFYQFAATYCIKTQNKTLFRATLDKVMNSDVGEDPDEMVLMNQIARKKARELREREEELFLE